MSQMTLPTELQKGLMTVAIVDCIIGLTGLRPPAEREQIPPEMRPHIDRLMFEIWRIATERQEEGFEPSVSEPRC